MRNLKEITDEMRDVIKFFGLTWDQRDQVLVGMEAGGFSFQYKGKKVHIEFPQDNMGSSIGELLKSYNNAGSLITSEEAEQLTNNGSKP